MEYGLPVLEALVKAYIAVTATAVDVESCCCKSSLVFSLLC